MSSQGVWQLQQRQFLDLHFMLAFLANQCPEEFQLGVGSIKNVIGKADEGHEIDDVRAFDELLFQIKQFFISRNLDGKTLFRVLSRQAQQQLAPNVELPAAHSQLREELLWKVQELVFLVCFFWRKDPIFNAGVDNLETSRW